MSNTLAQALHRSAPGITKVEQQSAEDSLIVIDRNITYAVAEHPDHESLVRLNTTELASHASAHWPFDAVQQMNANLRAGIIPTGYLASANTATSLGAGSQSQPAATTPQASISDETLRIIDGYLGQILDGTTYMRHDKPAIPLILNDATAKAELENHIANTHGLGFVPRKELNDANNALTAANAEITQLKADLAAARQAPPGTYTEAQVNAKLDTRDGEWRTANEQHRVDKTEVAAWFEALDGIKGKDSKNLPGLKGKKVLEPAEVRIFDATLVKMKKKLPVSNNSSN